MNGEPFTYWNWTDESPSGLPENIPAMLGKNNGGYTVPGKWNDLGDDGRYCNRWLLEWDTSDSSVDRWLAVLGTLGEAGADLKVRNKYGKTPMMLLLEASRKTLPPDDARKLGKKLTEIRRNQSRREREAQSP